MHFLIHKWWQLQKVCKWRFAGDLHVVSFAFCLCFVTTNCQFCYVLYCYITTVVESSWNVMAHGDAWEGKWRGNWRMEWVASTLHTTSEHGVFSIATADAHTSAASSRLNWHPLPIYMDSSVSPKDEIRFLRVCHHISNAVYYQLQSDLFKALCIACWIFSSSTEPTGDD
jgi:hypothetical protein